MRTKDFASLGKRLLPGLPGFVVKGPMVFAAPIKNVLRGLCFEGSAFNKDTFYVWAFVLPLYVPADHISFTFGRRLRDRSNQGQWSANAADLIAELCTSVKRDSPPFLSIGVESPLGMMEIASSLENPKNPYVQEAIAYSLARAGDFDQAAAALDRLATLLDTKVSWQSVMADRARTLRATIAENPTVVHQQLEAWEAESARNLGLEEFR